MGVGQVAGLSNFGVLTTPIMDKQQAVDLFLAKLADWENASKPDAYT